MREATIYQNAQGGFVIQTKRSLILKRGTPPVSAFDTEAEAIATAKMLGFVVVPSPASSLAGGGR